MEFHKLSEYFPMLPKEEFKKLKESIREHGLREAIVTLDGKILDGRNRYNACNEIGVEPRFESYTPEEDDALDFVVDMNMRRRHLTQGQKAQIMIDIKGEPVPDYGGTRAQTKSDTSRRQARSDKPSSYRDMARDAGVSEKTVARVARVQDQEDLTEKLREGEMDATEAQRERSKRIRDKAEIKPTMSSLYKKAPDAKSIVHDLGRITNGVDKWLTNDYGLDKLDPKGHTPLLIKKTEKAISELERFKAALEELRDG